MRTEPPKPVNIVIVSTLVTESVTAQLWHNKSQWFVTIINNNPKHWSRRPRRYKFGSDKPRALAAYAIVERTVAIRMARQAMRGESR